MGRNLTLDIAANQTLVQTVQDREDLSHKETPGVEAQNQHQSMPSMSDNRTCEM